MNKTEGIFICHNLLSVYKSYYFAKEQNIENLHLIYYDRAVHLPKEMEKNLSKNFDIYFCRYNGRESGFVRFFEWRKSANKIIRAIDRILIKNPQADLYLYLDHWEIMPTILEHFSKTTVHNQIFVLEEGLGIYSPYQELSVSHFGMKKIVFKILGLSTYCLKTCTIGVNDLLNGVYCKDVEKLKSINKVPTQKIRFEGEIINKKNSFDFLRILGFEDEELSKRFDGYRFVFLTQPMTDILEEEKLKVLIYEIIKVLQQSGRVLIKIHPRDRMDYQYLSSSKVNICNEIYDVVPFECFFPLLEESILVTFNSSCCNNVDTKKKSIYLYRLLNNPEFSAICDNTKFDTTKVSILNSISELAINTGCINSGSKVLR